MLNSMTFNGIRKPHIYLLAGRRKPPFASRTHTLLQRQHGAKKGKTTTLPLQIIQPIGYQVTGNQSALKLKDELTSWLITDDPVPLQFDDEPGRTYLAIVENTIDDFDRFAETREGSLQFLCSDPYGYGLSKQISVTSSFSYYTITGQVSPYWNSKTVFNATASRFTLELGSGEKIVLNFEFVPTDVLEIDLMKRKIVLNGILQMASLSLDSTWFKLKPGTNRIRASHPTSINYQETFY
ncbi:distal tail protein Dit [Alkalicoccobacillus gibsonii]|uniref:distal tail protein Dit n=1 Tax=Alkalicoccobacillus gibsonii TaxID=79881 RepID=UPI003F7CBFC9